MNSFTQKKIRVTFILAGTNQVFAGTNNNTLVLTDLRTSAKVTQVARLATQAELRVYGMTAADMAALTIVWANPPLIFDHLVTIEADDGNGYVQVFKGMIVEAQPEFRAAPEVYFSVLGVTGYATRVDAALATPTSFPDSVSADVAIATLIDRMGFTAEITGEVGAVTLTNPYFSGSLWDQFTKACQSAGADFYLQGDVILVTASGKPRNVQPSVLLTPESGLIGYPVYDRAGLNIDAVFNPAFLCGTPIELRSSVPSATGRWYPYKLVHHIEAQLPGGDWRTQLVCIRALV